MTVKINCNSCKKEITVPDDWYQRHQGKKANCPYCKNKTVIPFPESEVIPEAKSEHQHVSRMPPRLSMNKKTRSCPFCGEEIFAVAVKCKHCQSMLDGSNQHQKVTVAGRDPFAEYHTKIQGKKKGKLTLIGWCGIGLGILIMGVAGMMFGKDELGQEEQIFYFLLIGIGFSVASYLWARR